MNTGNDMPSQPLGSQIWQHRAWIAPGILVALIAAVASIYSIGIFPPSLTRDTAEFASASTQVVIDSPKPSSLTDLDRNIVPLADRANVFSRLLASPTLVALVGRKAGVPPGAIDAKGPFNVNQPRAQREPTAERRASQLRFERSDYRLRFDSEPNLPLVTILAQAPTIAKARQMANASATALADYVEDVQSREEIPETERVVVSQLGAAEGGVVNPGVDRQIAALTFGGVLLGWSLLVLAASALLRRWRRRGAPVPSQRRFGSRQPDTRDEPVLDLDLLEAWER